ncbi:retrotransposon protein [Cucumis melo var. makuwa]|uniref:Retrotransposon protein n=1 Tax=Cucumis melo var. makuwa TaxID=1194695 RepID=A0A5D3E574_CUCMM|nr:retrotransposon protein [Cucumis melo var. makuwa]TYK30741.1 retrotransposon protein [Cucumis melo var. makuwa]
MQNCLGVLDGTYLKVNVTTADRPRYRTRKGRVATNVLGDITTYAILGTPTLKVFWLYTEDKDTTYKGVVVTTFTILRPQMCGVNGGMIWPQKCSMNESYVISSTLTVVCLLHPVAKGLLNESFSYYNDLSYVFIKDHAIGTCIKTFADVRSNVPRGFEGFSTNDAKDPDIPMMYSQGLDMSLDQLKVIPKCSNTQRQVEDEYITECVNQLQDILELSSRIEYGLYGS